MEFKFGKLIIDKPTHSDTYRFYYGNKYSEAKVIKDGEEIEIENNSYNGYFDLECNDPGIYTIEITATDAVTKEQYIFEIKDNFTEILGFDYNSKNYLIDSYIDEWGDSMLTVENFDILENEDSVEIIGYLGNVEEVPTEINLNIKSGVKDWLYDEDMNLIVNLENVILNVHENSKGISYVVFYAKLNEEEIVPIYLYFCEKIFPVEISFKDYNWNFDFNEMTYSFGDFLFDYESEFAYVEISRNDLDLIEEQVPQTITLNIHFNFDPYEDEENCKFAVVDFFKYMAYEEGDLEFEDLDIYLPYVDGGGQIVRDFEVEMSYIEMDGLKGYTTGICLYPDDFWPNPLVFLLVD